MTLSSNTPSDASMNGTSPNEVIKRRKLTSSTLINEIFWMRFTNKIYS